MGVELMISQVEECLARMNGIPAGKRKTFQARLKQWQKLKFPREDRPGRGTKPTYDLSDIAKLQLLYLLLRAGLTPERGIYFVKVAWPQFRSLLQHAGTHFANRDGVASFAVIGLNSLAELEDGQGRRTEPGSFSLAAIDSDKMMFPPPEVPKELLLEYRRRQLSSCLLLDISTLIEDLLLVLRDEMGVREEDIVEDFQRLSNEVEVARSSLSEDDGHGPSKFRGSLDRRLEVIQEALEERLQRTSEIEKILSPMRGKEGANGDDQEA